MEQTDKIEAQTALEAARSELQACEAEIAARTADAEQATKAIGTAVDAEAAKALILTRSTAMSLVEEFLTPKRTALIAKVSAATVEVNRFIAQEQAEALGREYDTNVSEINACSRELIEALEAVEQKAIEVESRGKTMVQHTRAIQALNARGATVTPTVVLESKDVGVVLLLEEARRLGTFTAFEISREFWGRLEKLGAYQDGGK